MAKLSVIIPVYNRSIITLTEDLSNCDIVEEILIVDDCGDFIEYSNCNKVRLFRNNENMGPGYSRNLALRYARADYILFIDSDDQIDIGSLEKAFAQVTFLESDLCVSPILFESGERRMSEGTLYNRLVLNSLGVPAWNKIYRKKFLVDNEIVFSETRMFEDHTFYIRCSLHARSITFVEKSWLLIDENPKSLSRKYNAIMPQEWAKIEKEIFDESIPFWAKVLIMIKSRIFKAVHYRNLGFLWV